MRHGRSVTGAFGMFWVVSLGFHMKNSTMDRLGLPRFAMLHQPIEHLRSRCRLAAPTGFGHAAKVM